MSGTFDKTIFNSKINIKWLKEFLVQERKPG